jgi:hypothetical protein
MQRPIALAFILCEQNIVEEATRNLTPVNCFSQRAVSQTPSETFPFVALAQLANGDGDMSLGVIIQRLDNLDEIYRRFVKVRFPDPLQEARFTMRIADCSFPVTGYYQVMLMAENEIIAQRKLRIQLKGAGT